MRTAEFVVASDISREVCREGGRPFRRAVLQLLKEEADEPQRGPRGGRYERISGLTFEAFPEDIRAYRTMAVRFTAKYVRPKR